MRNFICRILFLISAFIFGFFLDGYSQNGSIVGSVVDSSYTSMQGDSVVKDVLIGASVIIVEKNIGVMTDADGKYEILNLPAGTYTINVNYFGYNTKIISGVKVLAGKKTRLDLELSSSVMLIDEVVITAAPKTNTAAEVINEIRRSDQVVSGISAEQISKTQDRDAAEVVKRVSGITVVDNRFVMVRGLSERYNTVLLNNAVTPSAEPDVKAFSFDIIPSSVIDRIIIYKSPAPEISGEFAGGVIKVYTKDIPEVNSFTVGYSSSYRQNSTGRDFIYQKKGKYDWLGYDDGTYKLPKNFPDNFNDPTIDKVKAGRVLNNTWLPEYGKAPVDHRFNIGFNRKIYISDKVTFGTLSSVNYSNTSSIISADRLLIQGIGDTTFVYRDDIYSNSVRIGALQNFSAHIGPHKIQFKNLYSHLGVSEYTVREGKTNNSGQMVKNQYLYKSYRDIFTSQLNGVHALFKDTKVDWTIGYSEATKDEPDFRAIDQRKSSPEMPYSTDVKSVNNPTFSSLGRLYSENIEVTKMAAANLQQPIAIKHWEDLIPELRIGIYLIEKKRRSSIRSIAMVANQANTSSLGNLPLDVLFSDVYLNQQNGLYLGDATMPEWSYLASNKLIAYYGGIFLPISTKLNFYPGIRIENNRQQLMPANKDKNGLDPFEEIDNHIVSVLPSFNLNYNISETSILRAAYGKTLNRPEFRELAPYSMYDFNQGVVWKGNRDLKTPVIHNFDIRYEVYPDFGETFNIGVFYKRFVYPIERVVSGSNPEFTFNNANSSRSIGVELDLVKSLGNILQGKDVLDNFYLNLNTALISSKVELPVSEFETSDRPMVGQSPYILNVGMNYRNDSLRFDISLVYNIIGRRLSIVGQNDWPSIYEMPRHQMDITLSKRLGRCLELKGGIADVFNARYQFLSDHNMDKKFDRKGNDNEFLGFRRGVYYTFGIFLKL